MIKLGNLLKVFISCQLILVQGSGPLSEGETRILNGHSTTIDEVPHLVQLRVDNWFSCGGAVLSPTQILTAAHCVRNIAPERLTVIAGSSTANGAGGVRSSVKKIFVPKSYNPQTYDMDVAVLKLSKPLTGSSVKPATICRTAFKHGDTVKLYGWGRVYENIDYMPNNLQTVSVNVIDNSICEKKYKPQGVTLTDSMFCAAAPGKDSCSGDSGGPAMVNGEICGIVSWGIGCGRDQSPGVYTNIFHVLPFIRACLQM